jgi:hypothetical protein
MLSFKEARKWRLYNKILVIRLAKFFDDNKSALESNDYNLVYEVLTQQKDQLANSAVITREIPLDEVPSALIFRYLFAQVFDSEDSYFKLLEQWRNSNENQKITLELDMEDREKEIIARVQQLIKNSMSSDPHASKISKFLHFFTRKSTSLPPVRSTFLGTLATFSLFLLLTMSASFANAQISQEPFVSQPTREEMYHYLIQLPQQVASLFKNNTNFTSTSGQTYRIIDDHTLPSADALYVKQHTEEINRWLEENDILNVDEWAKFIKLPFEQSIDSLKNYIQSGVGSNYEVRSHITREELNVPGDGEYDENSNIEFMGSKIWPSVNNFVREYRRRYTSEKLAQTRGVYQENVSGFFRSFDCYINAMGNIVFNISYVLEYEDIGTVRQSYFREKKNVELIIIPLTSELAQR